jgi:hypothetical protein
MKKRTSFKDLVVSEIRQKKSGETSYGYLRLIKDINIFKEEPGGKVKLDFLPYLVTDKFHMDKDEELGRAVAGTYWYKRPFRIHRNVGENNNVVICPTTFKKPCPICEYKANLIKEGKRYNDEDVKALNFSIRNLYVVVPIDNSEYEEKPHIWDISQFLFQNKLADEILENEEYAAFFDPEDGYTLRIRFSEEAIGKNKFAGISRIDFEERTKKYDEKILSQVPKLDELLIVKSYNEIKELFYGVPEDVEDNDEDELEEINETTQKQEKVRILNRKEVKEEKEIEDEDEDWDNVDNDFDEDEEIEEDTDEENEENEKVEVVKEKPKKEVSGRNKKDNKCPYGHVFGKDTDEFDECEDCDVWGECLDGKELNE